MQLLAGALAAVPSVAKWLLRRPAGCPCAPSADGGRGRAICSALSRLYARAHQSDSFAWVTLPCCPSRPFGLVRSSSHSDARTPNACLYDVVVEPAGTGSTSATRAALKPTGPALTLMIIPEPAPTTTLLAPDFTSSTAGGHTTASASCFSRTGLNAPRTRSRDQTASSGPGRMAWPQITGW